MSSIQSIWSGVRKWLSGLIGGKSGSPRRESQKDLRERLNERIEVERSKAEGVKELRKELQEAQSDMKNLLQQIADLRRTSSRELSSVSGRLGDLKELVRRL